jgi:putative ABC transport system permease protein
MRPLGKKLLRNLWEMKGQALAISLVIISGVATYVMSVSTMDSLKATQARFYADYNFADAFCQLKRAPKSVASRLSEIPGIDRVETRVLAEVKLTLPGFADPVTGRIVSLPEYGQPRLNKLFMRKGRLPMPYSDKEVVLGEAFANAHHIDPGGTLTAVINGRQRKLRVVGIAISPEYIYQLKPGSVFPDFERYAVMWMSEKPLATAYGMDGAFNDVAVSFADGADPGYVLAGMDNVLTPYGGLIAYGRKDQVSHKYLSEEFRQLGRMSKVFPAIFLGVAAFLLNIVVSRLVHTQREQIAVLKAFGYPNLAIAIHYAMLVLLIVAGGTLMGVAAGAWLGDGLSHMYMKFYRFPFIDYHLRPMLALNAFLISAAAGLIGTAFAVMRAGSLPPAVAMRPEPPALYRRSLVERIGIGRMLSQPARMIIRNISRRPLKAGLTVIGISLACAILVSAMFFGDAVNYVVHYQFGLAERDDVAVSFTDPTSEKAVYSLHGLPGVWRVEPYRTVPVRLVHEDRSYRTAIQGLENGGDLYRLLDSHKHQVALPASGVVLTDYLAGILGVGPGDMLEVEVLEGERPLRRLRVAGLVSEFIGVSAYMERGALNRMMHEGPAITGAYMSVDAAHEREVFSRLHDMPRVAGTTVRRLAIESFYKTMSEQVLIFTSITTLLAMTIAFGVVYNSARIALSERERELGSLRVLGFTRGEASYILLGELALLTALSIPVGFVLGRVLGGIIMSGLESDIFRMPVVVEPRTYAFAASVVLASAALSAFIIKLKVDRLDLVAVLKTKE